MVYEDCFAYLSDKNKCSALSELNCKDCNFYRNKNEISREEIEADIANYNSIKK